MTKFLSTEVAGTVWKIVCEEGQQFLPQDDLIILESMKMEIPLKLDSKGTIVKILVNEGDLIKEDQNLLEYVDSE
jgi:acetyl-CoA carboxylase biotin carboxyl carrier protein|tara:strand:+ start:1358 stop:1582 length:225 start_codon:yes stop_codon:yes gene_type:complete